MARTGKTGPTRFGIQARVLALAILFTLLAAGIIVATSARSLRDQLRRSVIQSAESGRTFWRSTPCPPGAP